jgi:hypothetical protein
VVSCEYDIKAIEGLRKGCESGGRDETYSTIGYTKEREKHVVVPWRHELAYHCLGVLYICIVLSIGGNSG